jgi:hypothetical protein
MSSKIRAPSPEVLRVAPRAEAGLIAADIGEAKPPRIGDCCDANADPDPPGDGAGERIAPPGVPVKPAPGAGEAAPAPPANGLNGVPKPGETAPLIEKPGDAA